jgi:hypothetical protein
MDEKGFEDKFRRPEKLIKYAAIYRDVMGRSQRVTISAESIVEAVCLARYQGGAHPSSGYYRLTGVNEIGRIE